jgi:NAD(P)-dependent dehydrogenase (short-subunit alcohol dehydrogenase family)
VLITGGTSGIGRATAMEFLQAGSMVVIAARTERDLSDVMAAAGNGDRLLYVRCDVSREKEVAALLDTAASRGGRIDIVVNSAGVETHTLCPLADLSESTFDEIMDTNLRGVWLTMKYALKQMQQQHPPSGAIVNISSINGLGGTPNQSLYSAAKAGVLALTKAAAQEYAAYGIRVNAVVPGAIDTPMLQRALRGWARGSADVEAQLRERALQYIPMRRIGYAREVARTVLWLCTDAASYITGHSLVCDGGLTASYR